MAENPDLEGKLYEAADLLGTSAASLPLGDAAAAGTLSAEAAVEFSAGMSTGSATAISEARQIPASGFATPSSGAQAISNLGLNVPAPTDGEVSAAQAFSSLQPSRDVQIAGQSTPNPTAQGSQQIALDSVTPVQPLNTQPFAAPAAGATDVADEVQVTADNPVGVETGVGGVGSTAPDATPNLPGTNEFGPTAGSDSGSVGASNGEDPAGNAPPVTLVDGDASESSIDTGFVELGGQGSGASDEASPSTPVQSVGGNGEPGGPEGGPGLPDATARVASVNVV